MLDRLGRGSPHEMAFHRGETIGYGPFGAAVDLEPHGIRVNAIAPGSIANDPLSEEDARTGPHCSSGPHRNARRHRVRDDLPPVGRRALHDRPDGCGRRRIPGVAAVAPGGYLSVGRWAQAMALRQSVSFFPSSESLSTEMSVVSNLWSAWRSTAGPQPGQGRTHPAGVGQRHFIVIKADSVR